MLTLGGKKLFDHSIHRAEKNTKTISTDFNLNSLISLKHLLLYTQK